MLLPRIKLNLPSYLKGFALPVTMALMVGSGSADAIPISTDSLIEGINGLGGLVNVNNQNNQNTTQVPEIIIDDSQTPGSTTNPGTVSNNGDARFRCQMVNGEYTVMYYPQSQPNQSYAWAIPSQMGGGWTPQRRCNEITRRLEMYRPDGLVDLSTGVENNYNVICVTTEANPSCRIVLTVPPSQDAELTRDLIFQNLVVADSGQSTQGVYTFGDNKNTSLLNQVSNILGVKPSQLNGKSIHRSNSKSIKLKPFLDKADGGTAVKLTKNSATNTPKKPNTNTNVNKKGRLNPGSFR